MMEIVNNNHPLIVVDFSVVDHYRSNLYSEASDIPIKVLTRKCIEKTLWHKQCFVILPFTHNIKLIETKQGNSLELETFLSFCHIYPESTSVFEHAPTFTLSICEVSFPKKNLYLLTLDQKTGYKARELKYKTITIDEAIQIVDAIK